MKKIASHFLQTILFVLVIIAGTQIRLDEWMPHLPYVTLAVIFLFLLLCLAYGVLDRSKRILMLGVLLTISTGMFSSSLQAQFGDAQLDDISFFRDQITSAQSTVCSENASYDYNKREPNQNAKAKAEQIITAYDRLKEGNSLGATGAFESAHKCAKELLAKIARWQRLNPEQSVPTVPMILKEESAMCWPCDIVFVAFESIQNIAGYTNPLLCDFGLKILSIMLLFWLLFHVMKLLSTFGLSNYVEFFSGLLNRILITSLVAVILVAGTQGTGISDFYSMTASPILQFSSAFGAEVADMALMKKEGETLDSKLLSAVERAKPRQTPKSGEDYCKNAQNPSYAYNRTTTIPRVFDDQTISSVLCATQRIYRQTAPLIATGRVLVSHAMANAIAIPLIGFRIPMPLGMWIMGVLIVIAFSIMGFLIAFKLLDILIRLGFVIILTPLLLVASAFPISRKYMTEGGKFLLSSAIGFFAVAIAGGMMIVVFTVMLPGETGSELLQAMTAPNTASYGNDLYAVLAGGKVVGKPTYSGSFYLFLLLVGSCMFGIRLFEITDEMVKEIFNLSVGATKTAGAAALSMVKGGGKITALAGKATNMAGKGVDAAGKGMDVAGKAMGAIPVVGTAVGAAVSAVGKTTQFAGKATQVAGKAAEGLGKATEKVGEKKDKK